MTPDTEPASGLRSWPSRGVPDDDGGATDELVRHFTRLYYEYKNAICRVQLDAARRQEEITARFAEVAQRDQRAAFQAAQEAYYEYLRVFQRAQVNPAETGMADVYRAQNTYLEVHQRSYEAAVQQADARRREYAAEIDAIQQDSRAAQRAAFTDYLGAIKALWADLDPMAFDPRALGITAQSLVAVANSMLSGGQVACTV